jgi:beta-galactosidase
MVDRNQATSLNTYAQQGQTLDILVENQGRLNYGSVINDNKKVCPFILQA